MATSLAAHAIPLEGAPSDWEPLAKRIGDARFVLIGDATHGTHELYAERARLTRYLIEHHGFDGVAIEADWPDTHRASAYVRGASGADDDAERALSGFTRFPAWMWRNTDVLAFVRWLRGYNESRAPEAQKVGLYGLDLYSLYASIAAVIGFLDDVDPAAAARARERYACFGRGQGEPERHGYRSGLSLDPSCERAAEEQLRELKRSLGLGAGAFSAEQNARVVRNAEEYYRRMFAGPVVTWNLRDRHMADTLAEIAQRLDRDLGRACRIVVWEHCSHLGDARATEMGQEGELNVGQLARERYGKDAFLVGMTTYTGTVLAASDWEGPAERMTVKPALAGSFESLLHDAGLPRFMIVPDDERKLPAPLRQERLERAIGVVYRPETERASHWYRAWMGMQFDAIVHVDRTDAITALDPVSVIGPEPPETYPFAV